MAELSDIQRKMLHAMHAAKLGILRITRVGPDVIQVTVGENRWFGKPAVTAVMSMMLHGMLTRVRGQHYELTELGMRTASKLPGVAPRAPKRSTTCSRCNKRLVPGCVRCMACGARVAVVPTATLT